MASSKSPVKRAGKSLDEFRAAHDPNYIVPRKIKDGLAQLGDSWEYEVPFLRLCGLSVTQLANFREQFEEFYVATKGKNPKRCWAGTKATAQKLREMIGDA